MAKSTEIKTPDPFISREGWFYLAMVAVVFGGAVAKEVNLLLILSGMMLGPLLLNWRSVVANLRDLSVERKLPRMLAAGEYFSIPIQLKNARQRLGCWAVVVEEEIRRISTTPLQHSASSLQAQVLFPYVPACETRSQCFRGRLVERGLYEFGPVRVTTRFPFGLFSRTTPIGSKETLIVLPRLGRLTERWAARRIDALAGNDRRRRRPGPEGDFYGVREWRLGDGQRLVHWRRSARLGKLVVRQFERPQNRDLAIVLDLWQAKQPIVGREENVELAVSFAATVLNELCRNGGCNIGLSIRNATCEWIAGPASAAFLQQLMERLATVEPQESDVLPEQLEQAMRQVDPGVEIVLVGARPIDLKSPAFETLQADPSLREHLRFVRCIDASGEGINEYFAPM